MHVVLSFEEETQHFLQTQWLRVASATTAHVYATPGTSTRVRTRGPLLQYVKLFKKGSKITKTELASQRMHVALAWPSLAMLLLLLPV